MRYGNHIAFGDIADSPKVEAICRQDSDKNCPTGLELEFKFIDYGCRFAWQWEAFDSPERETKQ